MVHIRKSLKKKPCRLEQRFLQEWRWSIDEPGAEAKGVSDLKYHKYWKHKVTRKDMQQGGRIQEASGHGDEPDMSLGKDKKDLNSMPDFSVLKRW